MDVVISVSGRFHAFDLAVQLDRRGHLCRLITSLPRRRATGFGLPDARVCSVPGIELLKRGWRRLPGRFARRLDARLWLAQHFDRAAARRLPARADICVGWSGMFLHTLDEAQRRGMVTIVERGSSHVSYARELLEREYAAQGLRPRVAHPGIEQRELEEYAKADYIAVPSTFARRSFVERGVPPEKLLQLPYGVSLDRFRPPAQAPPGPFRIVHCGVVNLRKGCHVLLEAFHQLGVPDAELWMVGRVEPEMRGFLRRWGSGRVKLVGAVPQARLPELYGQASAFCLASIEDGFGLVLFQAMACGLPVVTTCNTGGPDLVREGVDGFVVPIRDVGAVRDRLRWLYEHPGERLAMGRAARERVRSGFSWDDYGERVVGAYGRVLAASRDAPGRTRA